MFKTTWVYEQNALAWLSRSKGIHRALNEGGTSSSKTYSILQLLILIAERSKNSIVISIVSESLPHLKRGCIRDFFNILNESQDNNPNYSKTEFTYHFPRADIEFFGADDSDKVRGPRRDVLFINEGNNIPWEAARGLDIRTNKFTFVDWNPVSEFWAHENWIGSPENAYIHSTYLDALSVLSPELVTKIEEQKNKDPNWWHIYGEGKLGRIEGLVYPFFQQVDKLPESGIEYFGLDFGYSNDPSVLVKNIIKGDELYSQELFYESGLTNDAIAHKMEEIGIRKHYSEIYADSAEPKSIDEIKKFGFNIKPCPKGADSVEYGHQKIRQFKQFWTKESTRCIKEQRNFRYITDKDGAFTEKTTHLYSHGMDARRYAIIGGFAPKLDYGFDFTENEIAKAEV